MELYQGKVLETLDIKFYDDNETLELLNIKV